MKYLLSIEFAKLKKLHAIKIILLVYFVLVPLWMYFSGQLVDNLKIPFLPTQKELWTFPLIWKFTTYCASYFNVLMGVIIVIITANEFSNRTFKQNIIDGMTKKQIIISKFNIIVILATVVSIYTFLMAFVFGSLNSAKMDIYTNIHFIFIYFLQTLCYFSFAFFFTVLIKKSALSIILFIFSFLLETIVGMFLPKIVYLFFPLNVFSKLTPIPFFGAILAEAEKQSTEWIPVMETWQTVGLSIIYMSTFILIAYRVLKRRDL